MNRGRPSKGKFKDTHLKLSESVSQVLDDFCSDTGFTKTAAVERAIVKYVQDFRKTGKI